MHCLIFYIDHWKNSPRPLGVYRIAHYLRQHDWDVEVIDWTAAWTLQELKALARSRITAHTKWIGISQIFTTWTETFDEFLMWIKTEYPDLAIISGAGSNHKKSFAAIDYHIQGYGEHAVMTLLRYLFSNGPAPKFDILRSGSKRVIAANDMYPAYPMNSLMVKYQARDFVQPGEWLGIEFARGCKFECAYCNFPVLGVKGDYTRDADDFREQIMDAYDRWGVAGYYVSDETFNDRTEKITKFADVVETLPFDPFFVGYIRADLLISRPRDREELARMNFRGHFYGIETFHHEAGKSIGKGMHPDRVKSGLLEVRDYFENTGNGHYRSIISLIAGLPHENVESLLTTVEWCKKHWAGQAVRCSQLEIYSVKEDKLSRLSSSYEKMGYRYMTKTELANRLELLQRTHPMLYDRYINQQAPFLSDRTEVRRQQFWTNSHMDYFDAVEIHELFWREWHGDTTANHGIDVFVYAGVSLSDMDLQSRLAINMKNWQARENHQGPHFVQTYIHNKLSI